MPSVVQDSMAPNAHRVRVITVTLASEMESVLTALTGTERANVNLDLVEWHVKIV